MLFELISGADFQYVLHHFASRARLERSWGQVLLESVRISTKVKYRFELLCLSATQFIFADGPGVVISGTTQVELESP